MALQRVSEFIFFLFWIKNDHLHSYQENSISSLDFNRSGEFVATIDCFGKCLVADVNTDSYYYHLDLEGGNGKLDLKSCSHFSSITIWIFSFLINFLIFNISYACAHFKDAFGRCRWNTNPDEFLLFIKYSRSKLNILDAEKKVMTLKESLQLNRFGTFSRNCVLSLSSLFSLHNAKWTLNILRGKNIFFFGKEITLLTFLILFMKFSSPLKMTFILYRRDILLDRCLPKRWKSTCSRG